MSMRSAQFKIVKGELLQFAVMENELTEERSNLMNRFGVKFQFNSISRILRCVAEITFSYGDKVIAKASNGFYFALSEETVADLRLEQNISVPQQLLAYFASLTFGALRGMCVIKAGENGINLPVVPPVNLNDIITEPGIFPID